jgi:hypothetical protein
MGVKYRGILNLEKVGVLLRNNLPQYCFVTLALPTDIIQCLKSLRGKKTQGPYSQYFIFFEAYQWAQ